MAKNGLNEELSSDSSSDLDDDLPTGDLENPDIETLEKNTELSVSTNLLKPDDDNGDVSVRLKTLERETELSVSTNLDINNPADDTEEVAVSTNLGKPADDRVEQNHLELPETGDSMVVYCHPADLVGQASDTDSEEEQNICC